MPFSFDIFCRVVDNYGDIGVCWRLARRLTSHPDCGPVRLWVDDLASFARIAPGVRVTAARQHCDGVEILRWDAPADTAPSLPVPPPADVVIEAFGCTLPAHYLQRMSPSQLWINLEYLSAETWVESCHALPSLQPNGLRKFFFFPGFTAATGGLLREPGLIARRQAWQADPLARMALLGDLGVPAEWLARLQAGATLVYAFCYPQAPLPDLMQALSQHGNDALVLLPEGNWPGSLPDLQANGCRVAAHTHAFVDQDRFDRLLWSSDLNIVRGEDSLVRGIWAARPMIWQAYRQPDDIHLDKLDAWLECASWKPDICQIMQAWNRGDGQSLVSALTARLSPDPLSQWQVQVQDWCARLASHTDLADRLLAFCAENGQTR